MQHIQDTISRFVSDELASDGAAVTPSTPLLGEGVLDSMGVLELVSFLEETYRIDILDEEVVPENFGTVGRLAALVSSKV